MLNQIRTCAQLAASLTVIHFAAIHAAGASPVVVWDDVLPMSVQAVTWSPDGMAIAVGGTASSSTEPIQLRDAATGALLDTLPAQPLGTFSLDYSADGDYLAAGGAIITPPDVPSGIGDVFEVASGNSIASYAGSHVAFSEQVNRLATAGYGITRGVWVHDIPSGNLVLDAFTNELFAAVALSPDGETLALGTFTGSVRVVSVATGQVITTLDYDDPATARVTSIEFSSDGSMLAGAGLRLGGAFVAAKVWQTSDYSLVHTLSPSGIGFGDIAFTPDSTVLIGSTSDASFARHVYLWSMADGQLLDSFEADAFVAALEFSPDGARLAYGQVDGRIVVAENPLNGIAFDLDGDGDADTDDYTVFADCLSGPGNAVTGDCLDADSDADADVDLEDAAAFARALFP